MKKKSLIVLSGIILCLGFIGCSTGFPNDLSYFVSAEDGASSPRLVIRGTVSNEEGKVLADIRVSETNVKALNEQDTYTYNYATTDKAGAYTIIRYRGRELPTEVCVVASDSTGVYKTDTKWVNIEYDSIMAKNGKEPYNGFATADFVLKKK